MKKNLVLILLVLFAGSAAISAPAGNPEDTKAKVSVIRETLAANPDIKLNDEQLQSLVSRLDEIKALDKKQLSKADKRTLRQEVKDIKEILKQQDYVLYISLTALLLIIILILLL